MASCICVNAQCGNIEPLGACAAPKFAVGSPQSGSISICNSLNEGIGFGNFPVIMVAGCRFVGNIERSDTSNAWIFNFVGLATELAGAVSITPVTSDKHCEGYIVSWGVAANGGPFISVRGESSTPSAGSGILGGTAYAVAPIGSAWVVAGGDRGLALFEDVQDALFEDTQQAQFST